MNMHKVARSFGKLHLHFSWIALGSNLQQAPSSRSGRKFNLVNLWANKPAGKCTPEKVQRCDVHKPTGNDRFYPQLISAELQVQLQSLLLSYICDTFAQFLGLQNILGWTLVTQQCFPLLAVTTRKHLLSLTVPWILPSEMRIHSSFRMTN